MAPATNHREVVLVAFGSLAEPEVLDAAIQEVKAMVAAELPGWTVRGATIGAEGSITRGFDGLSESAPVFPLMMVDGWILRKILPEALAAAGRKGTRILKPLGLLPAFRMACAEMIRGGLREAGLEAADATVVLAAHGSARGPRPAACTRALAEELQEATGVKAVLPGYLEETPFLTDALRDAPEPAICLPCFASNAWHATGDVPRAVQESGFCGLVLPTAGTVPAVPAIIAQELEATLGTADAA